MLQSRKYTPAVRSRIWSFVFPLSVAHFPGVGRFGSYVHAESYLFTPRCTFTDNYSIIIRVPGVWVCCNITCMPVVVSQYRACCHFTSRVINKFSAVAGGDIPRHPQCLCLLAMHVFFCSFFFTARPISLHGCAMHAHLIYFLLFQFCGKGSAVTAASSCSCCGYDYRGIIITVCCII